MENKNNYFPVMIDLSEMNILVIGGGKVAFRKVMNILDYGGSCTVISPKYSMDFDALESNPKVKMIKKEYEKDDVKPYRMVFCAVDNSAVSQKVRADCDKYGILVNVADVPELCNFIMPATIKRGDFIAAISTRGRAPFYAKQKRQQLEDIFSPGLEDVTELAGQFRDKLLEDKRYDNPELRYELFHKFLEIEWEKFIFEKGKEEAFRKMNELFE